MFGQIDGALYGQAYDATWQHQIYGDYRSGQIAVRGKNSGNWQPWRTVIDSGNIASQSVTHAGTADNATHAGTADSATHAGTADSSSTLNGYTATQLVSKVAGGNQPSLTSIIDWNAMKAANGGVDVRNLNNTNTGILAYGGDNGFTNGWPQVKPLS